jgi:hypothetical protein
MSVLGHAELEIPSNGVMWVGHGWVVLSVPARALGLGLHAVRVALAPADDILLDPACTFCQFVRLSAMMNICLLYVIIAGAQHGRAAWLHSQTTNHTRSAPQAPML